MREVYDNLTFAEDVFDSAIEDFQDQLPEDYLEKVNEYRGPLKRARRSVREIGRLGAPAALKRQAGPDERTSLASGSKRTRLS